MKWSRYPNLRRRPPAPNKNRGRLQRAIRRAYLVANEDVISSSDAYRWAFPPGRKRHYWSVRRILRQIADPIGRVPPYGAWLWRLRDSAAQLKGPEK